MFRKLFFIVMTVLLCLGLLTVSAHAQDEPPAGVPVEVVEYLAIAGIGPLIMLIVEVAKRFGKVPDGAAGKISAVGCIVAYAGLVIAGIFGFNIQGDTPQVIIELLSTVLKLLLSIGTAVGSFKVMRAGQVFNPLSQRI